MSIVSVDLEPDGGSRSGSINEKWERNYTSTFQVITTSKNDDPASIISSFSYGGTAYTIGTPYPGDIYAYLREISVDFVSVINQTGGKWRVTCQFGVIDPFDATRDPTLAPIRPTIEGQTYEEALQVDNAGNYVLNAAGDPYNPPATIEKARPQFKFEQNFAAYPGVFQYTNNINNDTWQGYAPYTCKFNLPRAEQLESQYLQSTYWKVHFEIEYNAGTWLKKIPNLGLRQIVGGKLVAVLLGDGTPATDPVALNSSGAIITPPVTPSAVIINTYHAYPEISFNSVFGSSPFNWPTTLLAVYSL